ncbi:hypothetical protein ABPG74_018927 [Tetrahymena malaccensis]
MKIFGVSNKQSTINAKDLSKEDIKEIQNQEISQSDEIKLVKNTLNNQNQDQKSSDNVVKEQEMKIFGISNNKISLDVEDLSKDDIKEIQNQEISQSDENKLSDNKKGNLIFQKNMEKLNHHLNQENLSNMKKEGEDQNTSILLHSDITLKKKIKILLQRNLANNKSSQKFNIQIFNTQEEQSVIINNENNEKMVYHQYISTNLNQQENKSEDFYSYAHTIHKGKQNILDLLKQQRDRISYDPQVQQPQHIANTIKQDQTNFNVCLMSAEQDYAKIEKIETDIENLSKNTYQSSNQFDQTQIDTSVQNEAQNKINLSQSEKQLTKRYDSCIQKLIKQIKELNTSQNEQDQQKLDQINQNQSASFKVQKAKIFQKLNENKFEFIKILNSYDKQTLIQGFFAIALLALIAITSVSAQSQADLDKLKNYFNCMSKINPPCQDTDQPCLDEKNKIRDCQVKCQTTSSSESDSLACQKKCTSTNKDVQTWYDATMACTSTSITTFVFSAFIAVFTLLF